MFLKLMAKLKGLKWAKNTSFNAFHLPNGGCFWYHAKAFSCNDVVKISWILAVGTSLVVQVISNFATWVSKSKLGLLMKYNICITLVTLGATCTLAIIAGSTSSGGCLYIVCGKTNIGEDKGVKRFWIACSWEVLEVEPNSSFYDFKKDNPYVWPLFFIGIWLSTSNSISGFPFCNWRTNLNQLIFLSALCLL